MKYNLLLLCLAGAITASALTNDNQNSAAGLLSDIVGLVDTGATGNVSSEMPSFDVLDPNVKTKQPISKQNVSVYQMPTNGTAVIKSMDTMIATGMDNGLEGAAADSTNQVSDVSGTNDVAAIKNLQSLMKAPDDGFIHTNIYVTLRECISMGLEKNLGLTISSYDPSIARENIRLSKSVFDPELYGLIGWSGSQTKLGHTYQNEYALGLRGKMISGARYDVSGGMSENGLNNKRYTADVNANLTIPLLKGFGTAVNLAPVRIARNDWRISKEVLSETVQNLVNQIIRSYYQLYYYRENSDALEYTLRLAYELRAINEAKVQVGMAAPLEITQADTQIARDEENLIVEKNNILNAEDQLRFTINYNMDKIFRPKAYRKYSYHLVPLEKPKVYDLKLDEPQLIDVALKNREALEIARLQFQNTKLGMVMAKNNLLPNLNAFGSLGLNGLDGNYGNAFDDMASGKDISWSAGMDFSLPIFYNEPIATYRRAKYTSRKAEINVELVKQQIAIEVRTALRSVRTNRKRISATLEGTRLAREQLLAEQEKYDVGQSTTFQVLQYQDDLASALSSEISSLAEWRVAVSDLARVTGTILEAHSIVIDDFYSRPQAEEKPFISDKIWR